MRLRGFSGTDPTFLSIAASLALTYFYGLRPWEIRHGGIELCALFLVANILAVLLLWPSRRLAWIAGAATALLTWRLFALHPRDPWLFTVPDWISRHLAPGRDNVAPFFAFFLLYLGPMVIAAASVRPDLSAGTLVARIGSALVAATGLWILVWIVVPFYYTQFPFWFRYVQVAAYLMPSVVTPLLVWRFTLTRRLAPQWIGAALATPAVGVGLWALLAGRSLNILSAHPIDCAVLVAFACAGPVWAVRSWRAHRSEVGTRGFDVILTSSETPPQ